MDQKSKRKATSSSHPNRFQLGVISTYHWNLKTKDKLNNEDNFKEEDDLKNEGIPENKDVPKKEDDFKNGDHPKYEDDPKNTAKRNMSSAVCASSMVVFAWKCRLFCLCAHVQCRLCYIYHVEFHFQLRRMLSFPVKHQLWSGCQGGRSSQKTSGKFLRGGYGGYVFEG